ncbi:MAG: GMP/IMP nucleotidase [Gammaproteobacteria bacterium]|nr:GMP/IMP nucleotidase [Gammaproteobacteria bacterium]
MLYAPPIDWDQIQTVLLDMDGTLLDLHFDNYFWQEYLPACWAEQQGMDLAQAHAILRPRFRDLEGTLAWYCLDFWTRELELDLLALKDDIQHKIRLRPHADVLLERLRDLGKQCVLVTNAHEAVLDYKLARTDLGRYFEILYTAHAFGEPKESARFWQLLENHLGFDRRHTLLIDDNQQVLKTAREYGIGHLLGIARPDSQQPPRSGTEFAVIEDFRDLFGASVVERPAEDEITHPVPEP